MFQMKRGFVAALMAAIAALVSLYVALSKGLAPISNFLGQTLGWTDASAKRIAQLIAVLLWLTIGWFVVRGRVESTAISLGTTVPALSQDSDGPSSH